MEEESTEPNHFFFWIRLSTLIIRALSKVVEESNIYITCFWLWHFSFLHNAIMRLRTFGITIYKAWRWIQLGNVGIRYHAIQMPENLVASKREVLCQFGHGLGMKQKKNRMTSTLIKCIYRRGLYKC